MSSLVHNVPIAEARAGMVLAEAVRDVSGGVLLAAGATLTEATLNALRRRGITSLGIIANNADNEDNEDNDGNGEPINSAAREAERTRQCERLAHLFRRNAALGATGALLERLMHYRRTYSPC